MTELADDATVAQRLLDHIDRRTTDLGTTVWREPVEHYTSPERFACERERVLRRHPVAFCPSAALREPGAYVARETAGVPLVAIRGADGRVRAFRNACRHRGTQLVDGTGCERALVCRYHGWTYELDGALRHVPHEHGFPGLDKRARGLVPVATVEQSGLVFVTQDGPPIAELGPLPTLVPPRFRLLATTDIDIPANWKVLVEGFLEGYHIRSTHEQTFFPVQYDNVNVVETFGPNSRIAFPYRSINKLRAVPPAERTVEGTLTYVYVLFPNAMVATFPGRIVVVAVEPLAVDRTRFVTYTLTDREDEAEERAAVAQGLSFVEAGAREDRDVACAIQRSLASGANDSFEFGLFEAAIGHFHRTLDAALAASA